MRHNHISAFLVLMLAFIAAVVAIWQAALGDWSRAGCWMLIVLYWIVLTIKNIIDFGGMAK